MCKVSFLSVLVLIAIVLSTIVLPRNICAVRENLVVALYTDRAMLSEAAQKATPEGRVSNCEASNAIAAPITSEPITDWQWLEDPVYGYAIEFPDGGWEAEVTVEQPIPFTNPEAILKRYTFVGPEGLIDLDIWLANGKEFGQWLEWYSKTRNQLPGTSPNATVTGYPAMIFVEDGVTVDMLTAFWGDGRYVFRLWYTITRNENGLQAFWHMLETFAYSSDTGMVGNTQIPESLKEDSREAMKNSEMTSPLIEHCCGYYSPTNPFPCCSDRGNCTWWVYYQYGGVPFRGDAGTWWGQVPNYPNWNRKAPPPPIGKRSIAAYVTGHPVFPHGHVSYANSYLGGGSVMVSYMGWCVNCGTTRTISVYEPTGYIFLKREPTTVHPETP